MRKLTGSLLMVAMMLVPAWSAAQECNVNWQDYNLTDDEVSGLSTSFDTTVYNIEDLWQANVKKAKVGNTKKALKVTVPGHDVAMYRLSVRK